MTAKPPINAYFVSDIHLGSPNKTASRKREKLLVRWLDTIKHDATAIYIMGDLFDFWFEYRHTVPRGYTRILGKLAELSDLNIPIHFFVGNHDMWMFGYFEEELGVQVHKKSVVTKIGEEHFFLAHGDGLGPNDTGYKILKKYFFANRLCQYLLGSLHPNWTLSMASFWSGKSRDANNKKKTYFKGQENDPLLLYAKRKLTELPHINYFVFGHQHWPVEKQLTKNSNYINLGDWIKHFSYAKYDGKQLKIKHFDTQNHESHPI